MLRGARAVSSAAVPSASVVNFNTARAMLPALATLLVSLGATEVRHRVLGFQPRAVCYNPLVLKRGYDVFIMHWWNTNLDGNTTPILVLQPDCVTGLRLILIEVLFVLNSPMSQILFSRLIVCLPDLPGFIVTHV